MTDTKPDNSPDTQRKINQLLEETGIILPGAQILYMTIICATVMLWRFWY